jgi:excisionase family DNA binding protein
VSLFDEHALRTLIADEVRRAVRAELARKPPTPEDLAMVSVSEAARIYSLAPQTIRTWGREGRLKLHRAGRVLRVRVSELEALLEAGPPAPGDDHETQLSPEELADRDFGRRRRRRTHSRSRSADNGDEDGDA